MIICSVWRQMETVSGGDGPCLCFQLMHTHESAAADFLMKTQSQTVFCYLKNDLFSTILPADCLKTASMQDCPIHWCHELFSNAENCGNAAIMSSDPDNKLLLLSYGTNFISDTLLNVAEKLFALNL